MIRDSVAVGFRNTICRTASVTALVIFCQFRDLDHECGLDSAITGGAALRVVSRGFMLCSKYIGVQVGDPGLAFLRATKVTETL